MIDALPLLPNGKINRRALPTTQSRRPEVDESYVAPRTPMERLLVAEWCDVLKLERIGIYDNFFELGGHSLLAAKVVSKVRNSLEVEMGMVDLFQAPTIASLAALLFPRGLQRESEDDLAALLGELAGLTDEEAQLCFDSQIRISEAALA
jgi:acyl carrier protein